MLPQNEFLKHGFFEKNGHFIIAEKTLAQKLGYNSLKKIAALRRRNEQELAPHKLVSKMDTSFGWKDTIFYTEVGAYILAMHCETAEGKRLRLVFGNALKFMRLATPKILELEKKARAYEKLAQKEAVRSLRQFMKHFSLSVTQWKLILSWKRTGLLSNKHIITLQPTQPLLTESSLRRAFIAQETLTGEKLNNRGLPKSIARTDTIHRNPAVPENVIALPSAIAAPVEITPIHPNGATAFTAPEN